MSTASSISENKYFNSKVWKLYVSFLMVLVSFSCNQNTGSTGGNKGNDTTKKTTNIDSGYKVINTTKLTTGNATKEYSTNNRKATQFAIDQQSRQEKVANFIIKISDHQVLICDSADNTLKDLSIIKQWVDKSGPSTIYDLKDKSGVEYSLDYYVDIQKKHIQMTMNKSFLLSAFPILIKYLF